MKVYIAGPYTAPTDDGKLANTRRAIAVGCVLLRDGHEPFVPHLTHFFDLECETVLGHRLEWEDYMRLDLAYLKHCQALIRLDGPSKGADIEVEVALELGIPVFSSAVEFLAWASCLTNTTS